MARKVKKYSPEIKMQAVEDYRAGKGRLTPAMSRRGNYYDNAMAENFFSILKTECIYQHRPKTFGEANNLIDNYIYFYNYQRIQLKTGEAPLTLCLST